MSDPRPLVSITRAQYDWLSLLVLAAGAICSVAGLVLGPFMHHWQAAWNATAIALGCNMIEQWLASKFEKATR